MEILVGGLEHEWIMTFHKFGTMIPTDELIFFRGVETTNQYRLFIRVDGWLRNPAPVDRWFIHGKHPMILFGLKSAGFRWPIPQ